MDEVQRKETDAKRLRGPRLAVLDKSGVSFEEGLRRAEELHRVIASNKRMDSALTSNEWKLISEALWCWTGTMTAYAEPGQKLGEKIEYTDARSGYRWVFNVPKEHQDKTNAVLVAEHPDYTLEIDGKNRVVHVPEEKVGIVLGFPPSDGWYFTDPKYGIPTKENGDESAGKRYLRRIDKRVGPVCRGYHGPGSEAEKDFVDLSGPPHDVLGIVAEAASGGTPSEVSSQGMEKEKKTGN